MKYFKKICFYLEKNNKSNYIDNKKYLLIADRERFVPAFSMSIFAKAICHKYKLTPIIISDLKENHEIKRVFNSFGFFNFFSSFRFNLILQNLDIFFNTSYIFLATIIKVKKNSFKWFIDEFKVNQINFGDIVYDTYIRNYNNYANPRIDLIFCLILFKTIFRTLNIEKKLFSKNIRAVIIGTQCYETNGAIVTRIAIKKKIKVLEPYFYGFTEKTYKTLKFGYFNQYVKKNIKKITNVSKEIANKYFHKKFYKNAPGNYTGRKDIFNQNKNKIKNIITREDFFKILKIKNQNYKKIILFASHAFSDSPHSLGRSFLFDDYYQFLNETINYIDKNNDSSILWLFKPHPSSWWYGEEGTVEKLVQKVNSENILVFPKNLNTLNAINLCDHVITGRGTIGMEFACFGKLALIVGPGPYSSLNIVKSFDSKKFFFNYLNKIYKVKNIENKKKILAKKLIYFLEHRNKNFLKKSIIFDSEVLKYFNSLNPKIRKKDHHVINNKLLSNLKRYKIENDPYYKDVLDKIII